MAKHRIVFSKTGKACYMSHLDLMRTMQRAFLRAGMQIKHTEGFHPHPYIAMPLPLPLFFSSDCEILEFGLLAGATLDTLPALLTEALPEGLCVKTCYEDGLAFRHLTYVRYHIRMTFDEGKAQEAKTALEAFLEQESHVILKKSKKSKTGTKELDIMPQIRRVEALTATDTQLDLHILLHAQNPGLNPDLLVNAFRAVHPDLAPDFVRFHRLAILDAEEKPYV